MNRRKLLLFTLAMMLAGLVCSSTSAQPTLTPIGTNSLSLGFQSDHFRWTHFVESQTVQNYVKQANFKLVRIFDFRRYSQWGYPDVMPCLQWNGQAENSVWNWSVVDTITDAIFDMGAEPLFCLGAFESSKQTSPYRSNNHLAYGMPTDSEGVPVASDYAEYASEWVKHFKQTGKPVRFYEIGNEITHYFNWEIGWRFDKYVQVWNTAVKAMRAENPNVLISTDSLCFRPLFDEWINVCEPVDFVDQHCYIGKSGAYSDSQIFARAEYVQITQPDTSGWYTVVEVREKLEDAYGKELPIIISETNLSWKWEGGTDERIQKMAGAVCVALYLRTCILNEVDYHVWFELTGDFGMINKANDRPYYPYYVHRMIGSNLEVGDSIVATPSTMNIKTLGWLHEDNLNVLLINRAKGAQTIDISNIIAGEVAYSKIDESIPYTNPDEQTGTINASIPITLTDYTVMLVQTELTQPTLPPSGPPTLLIVALLGMGILIIWANVKNA